MSCRTLVLVAALAGAVAFLPALDRGEAGGKDGALALFNGKDLSGWKLRGDLTKAKAKSKWVVGQCVVDVSNPEKLNVLMPGEPVTTARVAALINISGGVDLISEKTFKDCTVEVEFMIPKGSNSGIYLMGQYEVQIYDTFGKKGPAGPGDMGGIYKTAAPKVDACKKFGEWQKFVIDFQAPRFENGKKVANAKFVKVVFNGQVIHENVEPKGPTGGELVPKSEVPEGPIMIQGDHGPVAIKSLSVTPKASK